MKFKVRVSRVNYDHVEIAVDAKTEDEAEQLAKGIAENMDEGWFAGLTEYTTEVVSTD